MRPHASLPEERPARLGEKGGDKRSRRRDIVVAMALPSLPPLVTAADSNAAKSNRVNRTRTTARS